MESPALKFIEICRSDRDERLPELCDNFSLDRDTLEENGKEVNYLMDFMGWWDVESHDLEDRYDDENQPFVSTITHAHLPTDILGILSLLSNSLYHQANALMRRTVEYVLFSAWLDIVSRKMGSFDFYWSPEWKKLYKHQRMSANEVEGRVDEQVYELNAKDDESKGEFRERFFREATDVDYLKIFSKFICESCVEEKNNLSYSRLLVPEDSEEANQKRESGSTFEYPSGCEFCGSEENIVGEVIHFPDISLLHEVLKREFNDTTQNHLSDVRKIYGRLSDHFVHFSPLASNMNDEVTFEIGNQEVNLYGFDGALFIFRKLSFILCNYYMILKNDFDLPDSPGKCPPCNKDFESFM